MSIHAHFEMPVDYIPDGQGGGKPVYSEEDKRVQVFFRRKYIADTQKMLEEGDEASGLKEVLILFKKVKGDTNVPSEVATDEHKRVYAKEYEAFIRGSSGDNGIPVGRLYGIHPRQVAHLQHLSIFTVKELDEAEMEVVKGVDDIDRLKKLARIFQAAREKESGAAAALEEAEELRAKVAELEEAASKREAYLNKLKTEIKNLKVKLKEGDSNETS